MNSMTGFGKDELKNDEFECSVEVKTVNSRYRDIYIKLPFILNAIDNKIRKLVQENLSRGKIDIYVNFQDLQNNQNNLSVDTELAKSYIAQLNQLKELDPNIDENIDLRLIATFPDIIKRESNSYDEEEIWAILEPVFEKAIKNVAKARALEGDNLKKDVLDHADKASVLIKNIETIAPQAFEQSTANLRNRLNQLLEDTTIDENRVLNEIAILSDKLAIDEELTRLNSHMERLYTMVEEEEPIGRKLDFLLQELNRETNTIGSKTDSLDITNLVVDLKSELEKIREQVQNIE